MSCTTTELLNPAQHQFCTDGYIKATSNPLLGCVYSSTDTESYDTLDLGSNQLRSHTKWVRLPPYGKVTTNEGEVITGAQTIELQSIQGDIAYYSRSGICSYMNGCYNHDKGWDYEFCQEYWNKEVECNPVKSWFLDLNRGLWIFILVVAILIVLVIAMACLTIVKRTVPI